MLNEQFKTTAKENKTDIDILWANDYIKNTLNITEEQIDSVKINDLTIDWTFYCEMRSWGVKSVDAYAYDVYSHLHADNDDKPSQNIIVLNVEYYDGTDVNAKLIEDEVEVDVSEYEVDSKTEDVENRNMFFPTHVEIDFSSKEITVTF